MTILRDFLEQVDAESRTFDRRATSSPIDLALPWFAAKDIQLGPLQLVLVARLLRLRWLLNACTLIWILYHQKNWRQARGGVPVVEAIVISEQELCHIGAFG